MICRHWFPSTTLLVFGVCMRFMPSEPFHSMGFPSRGSSKVIVKSKVCHETIGRVTILGVGPSSKLLTLGALDVLERADSLVIVDPNVDQSILDLIGAEKVEILEEGKMCRDVFLVGISERVKEIILGGQSVVRVMVGDPFLFKSGGEEVIAYRSLGAETTVIPGISSALAAPLLARVPVTHRGVAESIVICDGKAESIVKDPPPPSKLMSMVFVGVEVQRLGVICRALLSSGHPDLWAAIVEDAGKPQQYVLVGSLSTLPALAIDHRMGSSDMTLIVGDCVRSIHQGTWTGGLYEDPRSHLLERGPSVTLVGAGPGGAEFITVAGRDALERADLVIADRLVGKGVLDLVTQGTEVLLPAPKKSGKMDAVQEDQIYTWVRQGVQQGKHVVRLKVGDPFLYGRGGEEVLEYRSYGVIPDVIPGVSSCLAAPLLGGIPLSPIGGGGDQVVVCTGYREGGGVLPSSSLPLYRGDGTTCVLLMAMGRLRLLCAQLNEECGWPQECGAAVVERAGTSLQTTVCGTLASIADLVERAGSRAPAVVVVGEGINLLQ